MLYPNRIEIKRIYQALKSENPSLGVAILNEYTIPKPLRDAFMKMIPLERLEVIPPELLRGDLLADSSRKTQKLVKESKIILWPTKKSVPIRFMKTRSEVTRPHSRRLSMYKKLETRS